MNLFGDIFNADKISRDPSSTGRIPRAVLDNPPTLPYAGDTSFEWVDFSQTLNPLGTPLPIKRAIHNMSQAYTTGDDAELYHELPLLIARRIGVSADLVSVASSIESILTVLASVTKACKVGMSMPCRSGYGQAFSRYGHELVEVPSIDGFAVPDPRTLQAYNVSIDGVMLANPSYPSSRLLSLPTLKAYCEACSWVIVDERGIDLTLNGESTVAYVSQFPNLMVLQTVTDTYAIPDNSLAYCVASAQITQYIEPLLKKPSSLRLAHSIAKEALSLGSYLDNTRELLDSEIPWMQCRLSLIPGVTAYPAEANYVLCSFCPPESMHLGAANTPELIEKLQCRGFLVRALEHTPGLSPEKYFCVAVKTRKQNEQLISAMRAIISSL